jgi:endonuclease YncB( thermonuclease family)
MRYSRSFLPRPRTPGKKLLYLFILSLLTFCFHYLDDRYKVTEKWDRRVSPILSGDTIRITDGDTLRLGNQKIRLYGIDAPEKDQPCYAKGKKWACGIAAKEELAMLAASAPLECVQKDKDKYNRLVAVCYAGELNINREMVRRGYAVAYKYYSRDYLPDQEAARQERRGIWQGKFMEPGEWRRIRG